MSSWSKFTSLVLLVALFCGPALGQDDHLRLPRKALLGPGHRLLQFPGPSKDQALEKQAPSPDSLEDVSAAIATIAAASSLSHSSIDAIQAAVEAPEGSPFPAPVQQDINAALRRIAGSSALSHASIDQALLGALDEAAAAVPADEKDPTPSAVAAAIEASNTAPTPEAPTISFLLPGGDFLAPALQKQAPGPDSIEDVAAAIATIAAASELSHSNIDAIQAAVEAPDGSPVPAAAQDAIRDTLRRIAGASALSHASIDQALLAALAPEQAAVPADEKDPTPEAVAAAIAASGGQVSAGGGPTRPPAAPTAPAPTVSFLLPGGDFLAPAEEKQAPGPDSIEDVAAAIATIAAASELSHANIDAIQAAVEAPAGAPMSSEAEAAVAATLKNVAGSSALSHASIDAALLDALAPEAAAVPAEEKDPTPAAVQAAIGAVEDADGSPENTFEEPDVDEEEKAEEKGEGLDGELSKAQALMGMMFSAASSA